MSETPDETQAEPTPDEQEPEAPPAPAALPDEEASEEEEQAAPDAEPDESQPTEPQPEALSEKEIEKRFASIEKRATTWRNTVSDVLGELAQDLEPCPRCLPFAPGFILPASIQPLEDEQKLAVKLSIGELAPPDLRQDAEAMRCERCDGYGDVLTGSRKESQKMAKCLNCDGRGWIGPRLDKVRQHQPAAVAIDNGDAHAAPEPPPATDPWGRFPDDPLYGVMPGFERV